MFQIIKIGVYQNHTILITDDYEKFVKQFYSKIYEILDRAFCIFPTFLCRVDLVSNQVAPLEGRLKVWRFETRVDSQGSTIQTSQIEASRVSHLFHKYSSRFRRKLEKMEGESK